MPKAWYNIQADLPSPLPPPLNPATGEPITPDMLSPIFPMNLIEQEVSTERWIDIPEEVLRKTSHVEADSAVQGYILRNSLEHRQKYTIKTKGKPSGQP